MSQVLHVEQLLAAFILKSSDSEPHEPLSLF